MFRRKRPLGLTFSQYGGTQYKPRYNSLKLLHFQDPIVQMHSSRSNLKWLSLARDTARTDLPAVRLFIRQSEQVLDNPKMPIREDLVSSALTFLNDPKVQSSPLAKRLSFLESKGLTQEEIAEVLNRLNNPQSQATPNASSAAPPLPQYAAYGNPYGQSPEPPPRDWRDWFIMAVVSSGVTYGLYTLAKVRKQGLGLIGSDILCR